MSAIVVDDSLPEDPLAALRVLADTEVELDRLRRDRVIAARAGGASWQQVGDALGISRQSALEAFTADVRAALEVNVNENDGRLDEAEATEVAVDEVRAVRQRRRSSN